MCRGISPKTNEREIDNYEVMKNYIAELEKENALTISATEYKQTQEFLLDIL